MWATISINFKPIYALCYMHCWPPFSNFSILLVPRLPHRPKGLQATLRLITCIYDVVDFIKRIKFGSVSCGVSKSPLQKLVV